MCHTQLGGRTVHGNPRLPHVRSRVTLKQLLTPHDRGGECAAAEPPVRRHIQRLATLQNGHEGSSPECRSVVRLAALDRSVAGSRLLPLPLLQRRVCVGAERGEVAAAAEHVPAPAHHLPQPAAHASAMQPRDGSWRLQLKEGPRAGALEAPPVAPRRRAPARAAEAAARVEAAEGDDGRGPAGAVLAELPEFDPVEDDPLRSVRRPDGRARRDRDVLTAQAGGHGVKVPHDGLLPRGWQAARDKRFHPRRLVVGAPSPGCRELRCHSGALDVRQLGLLHLLPAHSRARQGNWRLEALGPEFPGHLEVLASIPSERIRVWKHLLVGQIYEPSATHVVPQHRLAQAVQLWQREAVAGLEPLLLLDCVEYERAVVDVLEVQAAAVNDKHAVSHHLPSPASVVAEPWALGAQPTRPLQQGAQGRLVPADRVSAVPARAAL
mmetsp:Transcript_85745/g.255609  ORF Transcript_85745/g.255609 Transcript_85745/m.255609 type:complete len:437 (-) Transcript_85745:515-1825(-)